MSKGKQEERPNGNHDQPHSNTAGGNQTHRPDPNRKGNIMSALRKIHIEETGLYRVRPGKPYLVATRPAARTESHLKQVALFAAAPFIGLLYAVLFPFVGLGYLAVLAVKALAARYGTKTAVRVARNVALFVAAPFIGLAYIVALPFVGMAALAWVGTKAAIAK
jgi:hypothetical protein